MTYLLQFITYDKKHLNELSNEDDRQKIINLATILSPLEDEIRQHKTSVIDLSKTGNLFTMGYPHELGEKITNLLKGN